MYHTILSHTILTLNQPVLTPHPCRTELRFEMKNAFPKRHKRQCKNRVRNPDARCVLEKGGVFVGCVFVVVVVVVVKVYLFYP